MAEGKHPGGRPSSYTAEIAEKICNEIAETTIPLCKICEREDMPSLSAVYEWIGKHPEFAEKYARAKSDQAERFANEIVEIADSEPDPKKAAVRIDARKWVAAKLLPKKYGDRQQIEFPDKDGNPQAVGGFLGDTERSARLLYLLEQAEKRSQNDQPSGGQSGGKTGPGS